jgi:hypothetical protein
MIRESLNAAFPPSDARWFAVNVVVPAANVTKYDALDATACWSTRCPETVTSV